MTKEEFDNLSEEKQNFMTIGASCLQRIMNEMEDCVLGNSESTLVFTCRDKDGKLYYFNVTGYKENSPEKHDV